MKGSGAERDAKTFKFGLEQMGYEVSLTIKSQGRMTVEIIDRDKLTQYRRRIGAAVMLLSTIPLGAYHLFPEKALDMIDSTASKIAAVYEALNGEGERVVDMEHLSPPIVAPPLPSGLQSPQLPPIITDLANVEAPSATAAPIELLDGTHGDEPLGTNARGSSEEEERSPRIETETGFTCKIPNILTATPFGSSSGDIYALQEYIRKQGFGDIFDLRGVTSSTRYHGEVTNEAITWWQSETEGNVYALSIPVSKGAPCLTYKQEACTADAILKGSPEGVSSNDIRDLQMYLIGDNRINFPERLYAAGLRAPTNFHGRVTTEAVFDLQIITNGAFRATNIPVSKGAKCLEKKKKAN